MRSQSDMDDNRFWELVNSTVHDSQNQQQARLRSVLSKLNADEVEAFDAEFHRQMARAYTWDLWGAAYVIHGGASDDGFVYFRRWLVARGERPSRRRCGNRMRWPI
jgi:hypothetical protein